jgi:hypothetical protein
MVCEMESLSLEVPQMIKASLLLACVLCAVASVAAAPRTIIFDRVATKITSTLPATLSESHDLWVTLAELTLATKFVLKPQGICRDELCFPIPNGRRDSFLLKQGKISWFNLSEFARLAHQPFATDVENAIWYFGPRQSEQNAHTTSFMAPDFTLPDINGKAHSLKDYRGKKVLLVTWASW